MRLLLVNPKALTNVYEEILIVAPLCPPTNLASLAGTAQTHGHPTKILDLRLAADPQSKLAATLDEFKPDVVGVSAYTQLFPAALNIAKQVREQRPGTLLVCGGVHATALPEQALVQDGFDAAAVGEGEEALAELLTGTPLERIAGLASRDATGIRPAAPRPPLLDLDSLALPAFELFDVRDYDVRQLLWRSRRIAMLETSRGCPFNCSFCSSNRVFGRRWRAKSAERVIREIKLAIERGFQEVHFVDDGLSIDLERAKQICRSLLELPRPIPWELSNGIRVDSLDDEFLDLARRAGCYRIQFGIESGDPEVLRLIGKSFAPAQALEALRKVRSRGIETVALFILGLPGEDEPALRRTLDFAKRLKPDFARASILTPLPGSRVFEQWSTEGRILSQDWNAYVFHNLGALTFAHPLLSEAQIKTAYKRFYREFYFRPAYVWQRLVSGLRHGGLARDARYFAAKFVVAPLKRRVRRLRLGRSPAGSV